MADLNKVFLKSGEVIISSSPRIVWTVLGSCVSVVLHSAKHQIGAISHAVLPNPNLGIKTCGANCPRKCHYSNKEIESKYRYVSCSTTFMIDELLRRGVERNEITASVFGGASMFQFSFNGSSIGTKNVEMALQTLQDNKIHINKNDTLGKNSRVLNFYSHNNLIEIKKKGLFTDINKTLLSV